LDIIGTSQPGAGLEARWSQNSVDTQADAAGSFTLHITTLQEGDNTVALMATLTGYRAATQAVTVSRLVSPTAYKGSAASIPYNQLIKDPASMTGRVVSYTGQVFQYDSATTTSHLIVSVSNQGYGYWTDNMWIDLDPATGANVYKDTVIQFWGTVSGAYTYETTSNGHLTIPEIDVRYITVISQP
jgi:hypothetical protein